MDKDVFNMKPILTIFAGVNGSGKSTFYYLNKQDFGIRLNTDEIIQAKTQDWSSFRTQLNAAKIVLNKQAECLEKGISFNRELTYCGRKTIEMVKAAKEKGFLVNLIYFGVNSVEICKERVRRRVLFGGHGVSESNVEERYLLFMQNLVNIYSFFDDVEIYDNSRNNFCLLAKISNNKIYKTQYHCKWGDEAIKRIVQDINKKSSADEEILSK